MGALLIFFPEILTKAIIVVIGLGLIIFGALQMLVLGGAMSLLGLGYASLCLGALALVGGIVILFNPFTEQVMSIVAGSFLAYYGVTELISLRKVATARKEYEIRFENKPENKPSESKSIVDNVKDAEYTEVDNQ